VLQVWQTPVRQLQRVGTSQASARSSTLPRPVGNGVVTPLRDEGILVIGSGLTYHNLRQFFSPRGWAPSREFDGWLQAVLLAGNPKDRGKLLTAWEAAPAARAAHPREEHLLPLMVALGAAEGEAATRVYHERDFFGGITVSSWRLG